MPLIRYATGDYGYISDKKCSCGREMPVITVVGCREKDLIYTPSGFVNIMSGAPFFTQNDLKIKQIQFYQENKRELVVRVVKGEGYTKKDTDRMRHALNEYLNYELEINFEFLDEIFRTEGGKYRYSISRVAPEF